jgi:hypothetical protein
MADAETRSVINADPDAANEADLDAESMAANRAGRFVPHARVREWLARLAKGERVPPPEA